MSEEQAKQTVLIVDDREENRYTLRHALSRAGFGIIEAASGKEALTLAKTLPDVIVLDVRLPDMLGYEVCRRLRANPQVSHIPVLQLSAAFQSTESKLYALESGADAYLVQPAEPLVLVATVRSLARLHQAERQAQSAARQWGATFDALSEGVAIVEDGAVQRCNRAMVGLLDLPYAQIEQKDFAALLLQVFEVDAEELLSVPSISVQRDSRFFRMAAAPLTMEGGVGGNILIVADVTPQKQAEEALLLNERLAATGRMAHTIAHEINNPLEAITNLIYLSQHTVGVPDEVLEYLESAADEVARVSQISRQILSFHRETRDPVRVPIAELVEDVLALSARAASDKGLVVRTAFDRSLVVIGFPARLRQAFSNLIRNAIEASPQGGSLQLRISHASLRFMADAVPAVRVSIADAGTGIPADIRPRIFEAFFTTKQQKGSGVGLWLTAAIIQEHGGKLQLRSSTAEGCSGTCLSVLLPA